MRALVFVVFVVVPLVELAIVVQVQRVIGLDWTLLALVAISIAGAILVKREGIKAWRRLWEAIGEGRMPGAEVVDGALLVFAGALLLTPGFLTDGVGLALLVPFSRGIVNRFLRGRARHATGFVSVDEVRRHAATDDPVDVEVVDIRRTEDVEHRGGAADGEADELDGGETDDRDG